jgi:hypothetical protein
MQDKEMEGVGVVGEDAVGCNSIMVYRFGLWWQVRYSVMGFNMSLGLVIAMVMRHGMDSHIQWDS